MISGHMPQASSKISPRRRAGAIAVGLLYALTVAALPTVHAETEALVGTRAVEDGHSAHCAIIHDDASCPATGAFRALAATGTPRIRVASPSRWSGPLPQRHSPPAPPEVGLPAARGPPIA